MSAKRKPKPAPERTYTITVTETQAHVIEQACEVLCRLGMGQLDIPLAFLPGEVGLDRAWEIERMLSTETGLGAHSYYGIYNDKVTPTAKRAADIYHVIRHRLSWDRAIANGVIKEGERRDWSKMMGVHYDEPMNIAGEALVTIKAQV